MRFAHWPRVVALALATSLVLVACGGDEPPEPPGDAPAAPAPAPPEAPAEPEPPPAAPVVDGDPELLWSVETEGRVERVAMHPDGVVVAIPDDATYLLQLADGLLVDAIVYEAVGVGYPDDLSYSPDGSFLLAGLHVRLVAVSGPDGEIVLELPGGYESRVAISAESTLMATSERSGEVRLWDVTADSDAGTFEADERAVLPPPVYDSGSLEAGVATMAFDLTGELLVVQHNDMIVRVWDLVAFEQVAEFEVDGESFQVPLVRISPDGSMVAASVRIDGDQHIRVWQSGVLTDPGLAPIAEFEVLTRVRDLSWSPDGSMLAVASRLGTTIWDPVAGELVNTFDETFDATATEQPLAVAFTPDGGHVLITRGTRVVELWRLPGAEELIAPERIECEPIPLPGDVLFDTGSAVLRGEADPVLTELAAELADTYDDVTLTFVGHTDSRGTAEANRQLSIARAEAVSAWFAEWADANGVDDWELLTDGRGDTELRVADVGADGLFLSGAGQLNRRVEIEIDAAGCGP
jgi:outer membrane protein OmpA-like peptidoglycan-associated protein